MINRKKNFGLTVFPYYLVDTSVKSEDESFASNEQESISQSLVERFNRLPESPSFSVPRRGVTIR